VEDYRKYRPGYPEQLIQLLQDKMGPDKNSIVADIGSSTGISSAFFLRMKNVSVKFHYETMIYWY
jgi:hypothetical protein